MLGVSILKPIPPPGMESHPFTHLLVSLTAKSFPFMYKHAVFYFYLKNKNFYSSVNYHPCLFPFAPNFLKRVVYNPGLNSSPPIFFFNFISILLTHDVCFRCTTWWFNKFIPYVVLTQVAAILPLSLKSSPRGSPVAQRFSTAFSLGPDPGDPALSPMLGSLHGASPSAYVSASLCVSLMNKYNL